MPLGYCVRLKRKLTPKLLFVIGKEAELTSGWFISQFVTAATTRFGASMSRVLLMPSLRPCHDLRRDGTDAARAHRDDDVAWLHQSQYRRAARR